MANKQGTADEYLGYKLIADRDLTLHGYPYGPVKKNITKDSFVGTISSWVKDPNDSTKVWWLLEGNDLVVQHLAGNFKKPIAPPNVEIVIESSFENFMSNTGFFDGAKSTVKWIVGIGVVLVFLYILKLFK